MTRAKDIFLDAVDLDDDERDAFLDRACAGDDSLREEVESLLRAESEAGGFMGGAEETVGADDPVDAELGPGTVIGDYTLVRELGEGGFGTVYLARQEQPVRRDVALKVVKAGMDTRQVIRRFRAERQSLAVMNHPGIAKVFDAGTVRGRPYFVMEYVDGDPITDYADRARLTARQRLQLFERVCLAVQHAHSKGVVHRDIKPSNVLVTTVDGVPSPKVIDFGIAKAVQGEDSDRSVVTHAAQIVGTPQYMAPEQASTQHADVDTRADVYSLGVLLYELLTGVTPHDRERFRSAAPADLARLLHEEEPPLPSSRVGNLGDAGDPIAHARRVDTHHLWRALRGDLDWIVMRAIERDRSVGGRPRLDIALADQKFLTTNRIQASAKQIDELRTNLRNLVNRYRIASRTDRNGNQISYEYTDGAYEKVRAFDAATNEILIRFDGTWTEAERESFAAEHGLRPTTPYVDKSSFAAFEIDNVVCDLNGPEVPGMDGSSRAFSEAVRSAGAKELKEQVQDYTKRFEKKIDEAVEKKTAEIMEF